MRIAFFGTPAPAVPSLEAFLDDPAIEVAAVVTNPDRPSGRGHRVAPPPVKAAAAAAGAAVWQPVRPLDVVEDLRDLRLDACAVVAYGALLPPGVLAAGGRGFVNLHFSLLPSWRGAAPVQHAILHGDEETGVSCFVLDEGMDTGPVLSRLATPILQGETAGELTARLAAVGAPQLVAAVRGLVDGSMTAQPQDHELATYAPKIRPEDAALTWEAPAQAVEQAVRAFNPAPGAHTTLDGQRLKVHRGTVVDAGGPPGAIVGVDRRGPVVACGRGGLVLLEVQPAGKARMDGVAFANGYRPEGKRLGAGPHGA
ncbi:MAG TPA: methionyl-tRNA formyltransferase [Egibacteraceae bacterium]|nr:methionyl-tRNA formyltransferase [Egibacteraceae bacterium]